METKENNIERSFEFNITIVDIVFGILLGILFERFTDIASAIAYYLFFLTVVVLINCYYLYRKWVRQIGLAKHPSLFPNAGILLDIIADFAVLFFGFQMVQNFNIQPVIKFYLWFSGLFLVDCIWLIERKLSYKLYNDNQSIFRYWIATDIIASLILYGLFFIGKFLPFSDMVFLVIMPIVFLGTFGIDPIIERYLRSNKKNKF
jgi:hypothetical protein